MTEQLSTYFLGAGDKVDLFIPLPSFHKRNFPPEILRDNLLLLDRRIPTRYIFTTDHSQSGAYGPGALAATVDSYFDIDYGSDVKFEAYDARFALAIIDNQGFIIDEPIDGQPRISFAKTKDELDSFIAFFENMWSPKRQGNLDFGVLYEDFVNQSFEDKKGQLVEVSNSIWIDVINNLKIDPKELFKMSPRQFEELIAELLDKQGYNVQITPQTRDGGKDLLIATPTELGDLIYLVECKKYSEKNPVGVSIVRELYGVLEAERATAGLIVTTSTFSNDAIKFRENIKHRMSLKDYRQIINWINKY